MAHVLKKRSQNHLISIPTHPTLGRPGLHGAFRGKFMGVFSTMRAAIYARVSTFARREDLPLQGAPKGKKGQDPSLQLVPLRETAARKGWDVVLERVDEISGAKARRPGRDEILAEARRKKVDVVMVWKLDRWGRSMADLALTLNELRELGVGFYSEMEALDFTTPTGRAMAGLLGVFAEFERDIIKDRVQAGVDRARAKGKRLGRPPLAQEKAEAIIRDLQASVPWSCIVTARKVSRMTIARIAHGLRETHEAEGDPDASAIARGPEPSNQGPMRAEP